jgi:hypothetical protein
LSPRRHWSWAAWAAVFVLLAAQYGLFRQFALREVVWAYPTHFDQAAALRRSYETYERMRSDGVLAGLYDRLSQPAPTGVLMPVEAALLFRLIGPSRLSALTLGFLHLALFQLALVYTLRWWSGRWSVAALGLGLLLSASAPFAVAGGLFDFRMDPIALCLWGVFSCAVVRSGVFAHRGFSLLAGAVAGVLVLLRFITLVYAGGVLTVMLVFVVARRRSPANVLAAALMMCAIAFPAMAVNLASMRDYYGPGHFIGYERQVWLKEQGLSTAWAYLMYYPRSLARDHAGPLLLAMCGTAVAAAAALRWRCRPGGANEAGLGAAATAVFLGACFLVPLTALTVHAVKSGVVGSILVPPLLWLTVFAVVRLTGAFRGHPIPRLCETGLVALGALALVAGCWHQVDRMRRPGPLAGQRGDIEGLLALYDAIGAHSRRAGWTAPRVSTDRLAEFLNPGLVPSVVYERQGLLLGYNGGLGSRIYAMTEPEALGIAADSDFVVVSDDGPDASVFPFEASMRAIRPSLRRLCDERFTRLGDFRFFGRQATLYARPAVSPGRSPAGGP